MNKPKILTPVELAERLHKSLPGIQRAIRCGQIPAFKIGRRFFIDEEVFNGWIRTEMDKSINREQREETKVETGAIRRI